MTSAELIDKWRGLSANNMFWIGDVPEWWYAEASAITAEIDRLTAERDAARAEIKRMTFGYGAWEAWRRWLDSQTEAAASQFILAEERAIGAAKG